MKLAEADDAPPPVRVVEKFKVAEYDIVILDADESNALEQWLNANGYKQPKGAAKYLAPYIQDGSYFFAAKVDIELVPRNQQGQALLSPIQFRYTSEEFKLPIRLGLLNARGDQDLLIFVLAEDRYEAANRKSIFIPTNISVSHKRKKDFATWYDKLFARQMNKSTPTMVTEYVWPTSVKCDPCPPGAFMLRGVNQLGGNLMQNKPNPQKMVLTRLHTRYGKSAGTSDIIFKKATPVTGGREVRKKGKLEQGATKADRNMFQARYAIRFRWKKAITCDDPRRGIWTHNVSVSPFFNQSGMRPPTRRPSRRPAPVLQELQ